METAHPHGLMDKQRTGVYLKPYVLRSTALESRVGVRSASAATGGGARTGAWRGQTFGFHFSVTSRVKTKLLYGTHRLARQIIRRQRALRHYRPDAAHGRRPHTPPLCLLSRTSAGNVREKAPTHVSCAITLCKLRQTLTAWGPAPPGLGLAPPAGFAPALAPGFGAKPLMPPICWTSFLF